MFFEFFGILNMTENYSESLRNYMNDLKVAINTAERGITLKKSLKISPGQTEKKIVVKRNQTSLKNSHQSEQEKREYSLKLINITHLLPFILLI